MKYLLPLIALIASCGPAYADVFRPWGPASARVEYSGTSSATKPTSNVTIGSKFIETDTRDVYRYTGEPGSEAWTHLPDEVGFGELLAGEDETNSVFRTEQQFSYMNDDADVLAPEAGFLHTVTCWAEDDLSEAGTIYIRDADTAGTGTILWQYNIEAEEFIPGDHNPPAPFDVALTTGLVLDFATTADVFCTVSYR